MNHYYELHVIYKNGIDDYYSRLAGQYWETDAETTEEALAEMMENDPDTFAALEADERDYYVTKIID